MVRPEGIYKLGYGKIVVTQNVTHRFIVINSAWENGTAEQIVLETIHTTKAILNER